MEVTHPFPFAVLLHELSE